jgi:hypothetical protein
MNSIQSRGGVARAEKLSADERSKIASDAARARWTTTEDLPKATHTGRLKIGDAEIPCAVLDNGVRVLTEHGITTALGSRSGGSKRVKKSTGEQGAPIPIFLAPQNIRSFISKDLEDGPLKPISYRNGRQMFVGYDATVLRAICEVWLSARRAGALQDQQMERAYKAELLIRGLADIGILSLVDEATGYQEERAKDELQKILSAYISPSLLPWAERFPQDFFKEMFRVFHWPWPARNGSAYPGPIGPRYAGKLIRQLIFDNLPPGVLEELDRLNPPNEKWQRKSRMGSLMTERVGHPHVEKLVAVITTLFEVSDTKEEFWRNYRRKFKKEPEQLEMDLR